jgi:predicted phage-related endonuclease
LFGGAELVIYPFEIDDALKEPLILQEAAIWANIQRREPPEASNPDDLRALFKIDSGDSIYATPEISQVCGQLKLIKKDIKLLEEHETRLTGKIQSYLREAAILKEGDKILATWKTAASSNSFSSKLFQQAMPDIYKQFTVETLGSRRLLIK